MIKLIDDKIEMLLSKYQYEYEKILEIKNEIQKCNDAVNENIVSLDSVFCKINVLEVSLKIKEAGLLSTKEAIVKQMVKNLDNINEENPLKGMNHLLQNYVEATFDIKRKSLAISYEKLRKKTFGIDTSEDIKKAKSLIALDKLVLNNVSKTLANMNKADKEKTFKKFVSDASKWIDDTTKAKETAKQKVISM